MAESYTVGGEVVLACAIFCVAAPKVRANVDSRASDDGCLIVNEAAEAV